MTRGTPSSNSLLDRNCRHDRRAVAEADQLRPADRQCRCRAFRTAGRHRGGHLPGADRSSAGRRSALPSCSTIRRLDGNACRYGRRNPRFSFSGSSPPLRDMRFGGASRRSSAGLSRSPAEIIKGWPDQTAIERFSTTKLLFGVDRRCRTRSAIALAGRSPSASFVGVHQCGPRQRPGRVIAAGKPMGHGPPIFGFEHVAGAGPAPVRSTLVGNQHHRFPADADSGRYARSLAELDTGARASTGPDIVRGLASSRSSSVKASAV